MKIDRQCLGRLFRVGQKVVIVGPPPSAEAIIAQRIRNKIILLGKPAESTGLSLHQFQVEAANRIMEQIKNDNGLDIS